jgi:transposase
MRGDDERQDGMFSYISAEKRVPKDHPLRPIRAMVDEALNRMSGDFDTLYSRVGRPSIAPERLLRALLLQLFYGIRSERLLMEQLDYNLLFRWFVGLSMDDKVWDASSFSKNRDRLLGGDIAERFLREVISYAQEQGLVSDEHFSVDGTLLAAWASQKSFVRKDDNGTPGPAGRTGNFRGEKRTNDTHQSRTDPQAKLYRKGCGQESRLSYIGNVLVENRNGLVVNCEVTQATGWAEREAGFCLMQDTARREGATLGADKGYDTRAFVAALRGIEVTPHIAQNISRHRGSAIDARTTRHPGYAVSQVKRKEVEHPFGWLKAVACLRQVKHRGTLLVDWVFTFGMAAYNLVRIRNLTRVPA